MSRDLVAMPLSAQAFAPFGEVIDATGHPDRIINQGLCGRFHDRARIVTEGGRPGLSLFNAEARSLPLKLDMVERHPLGSQTFIPMTAKPFLVIVAPGDGPEPGSPQAFLTEPGQAINFFAGTWHGVLTPLAAPGLFAVIDRIGPGDNLDEHWFETPWRVLPPEPPRAPGSSRD
ncbi:MAG: ureidoglycolate lyase [Pseudomonadota bacterium]